MTTATDVLRAIMAHKAAHDGNSPSVRALALALGLRTTSAVVHHLERLRLAGLIRQPYATARAIEVVGASWLPPEQKSDVGSQTSESASSDI